MNNYQQYKSPEWQKRRAEMLALHNCTCQCCKSKDGHMHVHHVRYKKDKDLWDYRDSDLLVLCDSCHSFTHHTIDSARAFVGQVAIHGGRDGLCAAEWALGELGWGYQKSAPQAAKMLQSLVEAVSDNMEDDDEQD